MAWINLFRLFFEKIFIGRAVGLAKFVLDLYAQLPDAFYAHTLFMNFVAIDSQEQVCNQSGVNLDHEAILTSGDQMVDF
jgi:hypothetical protein